MKEYFLPLLLLTLGWFGTHLLSEARERRKELRASLDKLFARFSEIEDAARKFHMGAAFSEEESLRLISDLQSASRQFARCSNLSHCAPCGDAVVAWRQAITLRNFDKTSFCQQLADSELIREISACTLALEDAAEDAYRLRYPHRFPYFAPQQGWGAWVATCRANGQKAWKWIRETSRKR